MQTAAEKYVWDALTAAQRIQKFIHDKSFDHYLQDDLLRSAVERQFEIVGEALGQLRKKFPAEADRIAGLPRIVGFRNVLIHGYATVDDTLVWGAIEMHLDPLVISLKGLLKE
jgi:uncharacterized protein with HEPN domain